MWRKTKTEKQGRETCPISKEQEKEKGTGQMKRERERGKRNRGAACDTM